MALDPARQDDKPFLTTFADDGSGDSRCPRLSLVVPTFNERANVETLISVLEKTLGRERWEVIFVDDDSTDGTPELLRSIAQRKPWVRCLRRIGRRGLSTAVVEGIMSSSAPIVAVMDADLQHDERLLPSMLRSIEQDGVELVVGSRYVLGGGIGAWQGKRAWMSRFATQLSRSILKAPLTDPMSGFFMVRRDSFEGAVRALSGTGYKILLDLFASSPRPLSYKELPYEFRQRKAGESKVETVVLWEYLLLLLDKLLGGRVPPRFISFVLVGGSGVVVHFLVLSIVLKLGGYPFPASQGAATLVAMSTNFALNNALTYSDQRLRGFDFLRGLISFYAVCAVGALANVGVASFVFARAYEWWLAGAAGVVVGTVWNYAMSAIFTWGRRPRRRTA